MYEFIIGVMGVNKIILDNFSSDENPPEMEALLKDLLKIESTESMKKSGVERLYDVVLKKYANNEKFVEWCKKYVQQ